MDYFTSSTSFVNPDVLIHSSMFIAEISWIKACAS